MPLGNPHGADFEYTVEGLPLGTAMVSVPASDPGKSSAFYTDILRMDVLYSDDDEAVLRREGFAVRLYRSNRFGMDTGVYISVSSPYDFHRRMIDEGVEFLMPPTRMPFGVVTSFKDYDGNILYAVECIQTKGI